MAASLIFAFTYIAFSLGRVPGLRSDRMGAAVVGGALMLAFRVLTIEEAQASVDGATIALLFGMMIVSAALEISGAFAVIGWWVTRRAASPLALLVAISVTSGVLSAFLINDVVCIAFAPLVLHVASALNRDPKPYLLALATSSNIGSVATITGNPQNILIGSLSQIPYLRFAAILAPVAALALAANIGVLWFVYRKQLVEPFSPPSERPRPPVLKRWIWKGSIVTAGVLVALVVGVSPALAALLGASAMLLTRAVQPKRLYARIDWSLLTLFIGLFVVVAGVEKIGLAERLLAFLEPLHPESIAGLTAITSVLSNAVSNVPAVMVMKPMVPHLGSPELAWLTLAMASTLAGNLTVTGSLASIIVVERAKPTVAISFVEFLRVGVPTALVSLAIGAGWLYLMVAVGVVAR